MRGSLKEKVMRKYDRLILSVFVVCAVVLSILPFGCKQRETDKPKIALIMKSLANEFFKTMEEGGFVCQSCSGSICYENGSTVFDAECPGACMQTGNGCGNYSGQHR